MRKEYRCAFLFCRKLASRISAPLGNGSLVISSNLPSSYVFKCSCQNRSKCFNWFFFFFPPGKKCLFTQNKHCDRKGNFGQNDLQCKQRVQWEMSAYLISSLWWQKSEVCLTLFSAGKEQEGQKESAFFFSSPSPWPNPKVISLKCRFYIQLSHAVMFFSTQFLRELGPTA